MRQYWFFYLQDAISGQCFYIDENGLIQKGNPLTQQLQLPQSPGGWDGMQLSFGRSSHYWGINRTFTIPLKFIGDGATIIRNQFYKGKGVEEPINLVILKWDDVNGFYGLYYSGRLDMTKIDDQVAEGVTVNVMEGGAVQFLKAFENSIIPIPLDGSIPENIKINADGIKFNDVFHYQIIPITPPGKDYDGDLPLPCVFLSNDGDNIGVIKNDPRLEKPYAFYYQRSGNFIFSSESPASVRIKGNIVLKSDQSVHNTSFYMFLATSLSQDRGVGLLDHATGLISPYVGSDPNFWGAVKSQITIDGQYNFSFDATMDLSANEHLFLMFFNNFGTFPISILGGSFTLTFSSRYRSSRVWAIKPYDAGNYMFTQLNLLSASYGFPTSFGFDSNLLKEKQNLVLTSGDAARASTDPNYYQYFNQATLNPTNPNNQDYTQFSFIGPALKLSITNLFDGYNPILNASLSNQQFAGVPESIFLERKSYVLDPSVITMSLTKIANFRVSIAMDYYWNWLKIGYKPNDYDEKAGKYEYNNTNQYQAPIRSIGKILELISSFRTDSYGFEYTRYNTQGGKSTTFNNSDNSIWCLNVDFSTFFYDYYRARFISGIPNPASSSNTNQKLIPKQYYQPVYLDNLDGDYFVTQNDFSILMLNQPLVNVSMTVQVDFTAFLNGLPGDSATIKMWINGVVAQTWSGSIAGVNTPFNGTASFSRLCNTGDNVYFTVDTVRTCTVEITDFKLTWNSTYFIAESTGSTNIPAGSTQQLISLPLITPTLVSGLPVVSSGFQYFRFLSPIGNRGFGWTLGLSAYAQGSGSEWVTFDFWRNGIKIGTFTYFATSGLVWQNQPGGTTGEVFPNITGALTFEVYDILWITAAPTNLNVWITNVDFKATSDSVKVYNLLRPAYSNVAGIPNPETAFNIEELTPAALVKTNGSLLKSTLFNLMPNMLTFQTADKNQFLSRALDGVTITERASIDIHDLDDPLFYPLIFEFDTEVPINFADLLNASANGHIEFIYNNKTFYGFPIQVTAKPALNESQTWKLLCSPKTNLSDLVELDWNGLFPLMPLEISVPFICPVHVVPLGYSKSPVYHNMMMDQDWFVNRVQAWIDKSDYFSPWQSNEPIPLQIRSNGLTPFAVQFLDYKGAPIGSPIDVPSITDPSVLAPQMLFQGDIDLTALSGKYYMLWAVGTGQGTGYFITEGIEVRDDWGYNTIRFDYTNSRNKLATVFSSSYQPCFRVHGQINRYAPKTKFTTFVDQPQDIDLLNAIPYDTWKLEIGRGSGVPDYVLRKINAIMGLDTVLIEGDQYTRDADAQWEQQTTPGQPKAYMTLEIRRAQNADAITLNTSGQLTTEQQAGYTVNARAFGNNLGQDLWYVSNS